MESKDRAAYLKVRADYLDKKAAEAHDIVDRLNDWRFDAELGLTDGILDEIFKWREIAEKVEWAAQRAHRELAELEGSHEEV